MPDSVRIKQIYDWLEELRPQIKEIHAALDATQYATNDDPPLPVAVNLGKRIERTNEILGIWLNSDGSPNLAPARQLIPHGQAIPAGYDYDSWGTLGFAFDAICNDIQLDQFNKTITKIVPGGTILCSDIPSLFVSHLEIMDKAFDLQNLSAAKLPAGNGRGGPVTFDGLFSMVSEQLRNQTRLSELATQTHISSLVTQEMNKELLAGQGLPIVPKTLAIALGRGKIGHIPFPGLAANSPSLMQGMGWLLENQSIQGGQAAKG